MNFWVFLFYEYVFVCMKLGIKPVSTHAKNVLYHELHSQPYKFLLEFVHIFKSEVGIGYAMLLLAEDIGLYFNVLLPLGTSKHVLRAVLEMQLIIINYYLSQKRLMDEPKPKAGKIY